MGETEFTSRSDYDGFGRKSFDELKLGKGFISRQFSYHAGKVTEAHKNNDKLQSAPVTQLVSQIILSDGRTLNYEYDAEERVTKVIDSFEGTTEYAYDALGQLLSETKNGQNINTMTYDNYGNILTKNGKVYTYGDNVWKDKLTKVDGLDITYDSQGNPLNYLGHNLTWEKGRQLKSFDTNTYTYNANGIRTSKTVDGVRHNFTLDGAKILKETWENNTLTPLYDNADEVCGIIYNDTPYFFIKNLQGDVIAITDDNGETVAKYSYDAWGVCIVESDTNGIANINPYRYRSYYYDSEIGMYYLQSRYYNPNVGRFVNGDEVENSLLTNNVIDHNIFIYVQNNPVVLSDSTGANWITDLWKKVKKGMLSAGAWIKKAVSNIGKFFSKTVWKQFVVNGVWKKFCKKWVWEKFCKEMVYDTFLKKWVWQTFCKKWVWQTFIKDWIVNKAWNWLAKSKPGQILWNANAIIISLASLILSIIGCGTPAAPVAIAGVVFSALGLISSIVSLLMAIYS